MASIQLPDGARITELVVWGVDNHAQDFSVSLTRRSLSAMSNSTQVSLATSGVNGSVQELNSGVVSLTLDNSTYSYMLRAWSSNWSGTSDMSINGARITYEYQ